MRSRLLSTCHVFIGASAYFLVAWLGVTSPRRASPPWLPCRRELQQVQASRTAAADFLLACLADVQQELLAQEGHAELMAAALPAGLLPATGSSGLGDEQPGGLAPAAVDASRCSAGGSGDEGSSPSKPPRLLLGQLTMRQREAALEQLLRRLQVDWRQEEGLLLPSTSGSLSSRSHAGDACPASPTTASPPPCAGAKPRSPGACAAAGAKASRPGSTSARAASAPSGAASCCTKSELMELVMSDVRPWGGPGVSRAGCRQLPSICEGGRGGGAADSERP